MKIQIQMQIKCFLLNGGQDIFMSIEEQTWLLLTTELIADSRTQHRTICTATVDLISLPCLQRSTYLWLLQALLQESGKVVNFFAALSPSLYWITRRSVDDADRNTTPRLTTSSYILSKCITILLIVNITTDNSYLHQNIKYISHIFLQCPKDCRTE